MKTSTMTDKQFLDFVTKHPVSGGCLGTSKATDAAVSAQSSFTASLLSQASQVFGADNAVWNSIQATAQPLFAAGPSQQGFSAAQQNAENAAIVTSGANATRFAEARDGTANGSSGVGSNKNAMIAEQGAVATGQNLAKVQTENYAAGNANWKTAGEMVEKAPGVYANMDGFNKNAQTGLDRNKVNAQAADAKANWWVKPVEGAIGAGLNMVAPGLGSAVPGGGGSGGGLTSTLSNMVGNTSSDSSWVENIKNMWNGRNGGTTPGTDAPGGDMGPPLAPQN